MKGVLLDIEHWTCTFFFNSGKFIKIFYQGFQIGSLCNFRSTEIKTQMVSIGESVANVQATFPVIWYPRFK